MMIQQQLPPKPPLPKHMPISPRFPDTGTGASAAGIRAAVFAPIPDALICGILCQRSSRGDNTSGP